MLSLLVRFEILLISNSRCFEFSMKYLPFFWFKILDYCIACFLFLLIFSWFNLNFHMFHLFQDMIY
uniref:Putative ovule protein n=1 Tax=Solanum chacoense TaxID=4108 RepID=A0A0V0GWF3_SOLCH